jgi:hypothetical protein
MSDWNVLCSSFVNPDSSCRFPIVCRSEDTFSNIE